MTASYPSPGLGAPRCSYSATHMPKVLSDVVGRAELAKGLEKACGAAVLGVSWAIRGGLLGSTVEVVAILAPALHAAV